MSIRIQCLQSLQNMQWGGRQYVKSFLWRKGNYVRKRLHTSCIEYGWTSFAHKSYWP